MNHSADMHHYGENRQESLSIGPDNSVHPQSRSPSNHRAVLTTTKEDCSSKGTNEVEEGRKESANLLESEDVLGLEVRGQKRCLQIEDEDRSLSIRPDDSVSGPGADHREVLTVIDDDKGRSFTERKGGGKF